MTAFYPFSKVIEEIERAMGPLEIGEAIRFIDERFGNAWSLTIERFEAALFSKDPVAIASEGDLYRSNVLDYIRLFKEHKAANDVRVFLDSLCA